MKFQRMTIVIENDVGSVRQGVDRASGKPWRTVMPYPYGYIKGTKGVDGDAVDAFVGPVKGAKFVYIIHQTDKNIGNWDEDKVMLGFEDAMDATQAYKKAYDTPDHFFASVTTMPMKEFKEKVFSMKKEPVMMHGSGSKMENAIALFCGPKMKNTFKVGDQVTVDGMHGRGVVYAIDGERVVVRFRNGLYLSRAFYNLHNLADRVKKMWRD